MLANVRRNIAVQLTAGGTNPLTAQLQAPPAGNKFGTPIQLAIVGKGGSGTGYSYALISGSLPAGVSGPGASSGLFSGTPTAAGTFEVVLKVTDSLLNTFQRVFTIVVAHLLTVVAVSPPPGEVGVLYGYTFQVSGNTGALTWARASGSFPNGTSIAAGTGILSGTPILPGTFNAVVTATDAGSGDVISIPTSILIYPFITNSGIILSKVLTVGTFYPQIPAGTFATDAYGTISGAPPYYYKSGNIATVAPWATLNPQTGFISGTPTAPTNGTINIQVSAFDTLGGVVNSGINITITVAAPSTDAGNQLKQGTDGALLVATVGATTTKPSSSVTLPNDSTAVVYGYITHAAGVFITYSSGAFIMVM